MSMDQLLQDSFEHMAEGKEKDNTVELLQMCKANCTFMNVAINRTVDFAKSASDRALTPKMEPVSVEDAVQWAVSCQNSTQNRLSVEVKPLPAGVCHRQALADGEHTVLPVECSEILLEWQSHHQHIFM